jgi:3',5'-cyclic-AMP phosphodiesterase
MTVGLQTGLHVVQLSDTHLFADLDGKLVGVTTSLSLRSVLATLGERTPRPDLLLLTGDLSQDESLESYQYLQTWLVKLGIPNYWLPGNHDNIERLQAALTTDLCSQRQSFYRGGWKFLLLNSQLTGNVYGELSSQTLMWLELELQSDSETPTLIACHHPPFAVGSPWIDNISLRHPEAFLAICDRYPQIKLVLSGHVHQAASYTRNDVTFLTCPSTCIQFQSQSDAFAVTSQPPGCRLLTLYPEGHFETEILWVTAQEAGQANAAAKGY